MLAAMLSAGVMILAQCFDEIGNCRHFFWMELTVSKYGRSSCLDNCFVSEPLLSQRQCRTVGLKSARCWNSFFLFCCVIKGKLIAGCLMTSTAPCAIDSTSQSGGQTKAIGIDSPARPTIRRSSSSEYKEMVCFEIIKAGLTASLSAVWC